MMHNCHNRALEIATLGEEILASLRALYGKDELFDKAEAAGIFVSEDEIRHICTSVIRGKTNTTQPRVRNSKFFNQMWLHFNICTGAGIPSKCLRKTCWVPTIVVAVLSSWHEEAVSGTTTFLLWNYARRVLWRLYNDTDSYFSLDALPCSSRAVII